MSKTSKHTDKINLSRHVKHSEDPISVACLHLTVPKALLLQLRVTDQHILISRLVIAGKTFCCGCIHKCKFVVTWSFWQSIHKSALQLLISRFGPLARRLGGGILHWHAALRYAVLLSPATRAVDELGTEPDMHEMYISLQAPLMDYLQHQWGEAVSIPIRCAAIRWRAGHLKYST